MRVLVLAHVGPAAIDVFLDRIRAVSFHGAQAVAGLDPHDLKLAAVDDLIERRRADAQQVGGFFGHEESLALRDGGLRGVERDRGGRELDAGVDDTERARARHFRERSPRIFFVQIRLQTTTGAVA
jgi:hypothetical protein